MDVIGVTGRRVAPSTRSTALSAIADTITLANAMCGFLAIVIVSAGWDAAASAPPEERASFVAAVALILGGTLLDLVDGPIARSRGGGGSPIGPQLDVAADAVTFGAAPALMVVATHSPQGGMALAGLTVAACAYLAAVVWRVARFSLDAERDARTRHGMSSPMGALTLISVATLDLPAAATLAALFAVAALMVSRIPWPNPGKAVVPGIAAWYLLIAAAIADVVPGRVAAGVSLTCIFLVPVIAALLRGRRPATAA